MDIKNKTLIIKFFFLFIFIFKCTNESYATSKTVGYNTAQEKRNNVNNISGNRKSNEVFRRYINTEICENFEKYVKKIQKKYVEKNSLRGKNNKKKEETVKTNNNTTTTQKIKQRPYYNPKGEHSEIITGTNYSLISSDNPQHNSEYSEGRSFSISKSATESKKNGTNNNTDIKNNTISESKNIVGMEKISNNSNIDSNKGQDANSCNSEGKKYSEIKFNTEGNGYEITQDDFKNDMSSGYVDEIFSNVLKSNGDSSGNIDNSNNDSNTNNNDNNNSINNEGNNNNNNNNEVSESKNTNKNINDNNNNIENNADSNNKNINDDNNNDNNTNKEEITDDTNKLVEESEVTKNVNNDNKDNNNNIINNIEDTEKNEAIMKHGGSKEKKNSVVEVILKYRFFIFKASPNLIFGFVNGLLKDPYDLSANGWFSYFKIEKIPLYFGYRLRIYKNIINLEWSINLITNTILFFSNIFAGKETVTTEKIFMSFLFSFISNITANIKLTQNFYISLNFVGVIEQLYSIKFLKK